MNEEAISLSKNLKYCQNCGEKLNNEINIKFCSNCGVSLESTNSSEQLQYDKQQEEQLQHTQTNNLTQSEQLQHTQTNNLAQPEQLQHTQTNNLVQPEQLTVSPELAVILSLLLIGLGQMLNGQPVKGILMLIISIFIGIMTGFLIAPFLWIFSGIDAYQCAKKLKNGQCIGKFSFFNKNKI